MAGEHDRAGDDQWGNTVAKFTFIATVVFAAGFIGAVFLFIL